MLPGALLPLGVIVSRGSWNTGTGRWNLPDLVPGDVDTLRLTARVDPAAVEETVTATAAVVASDRPDPDPANDAADADLVVGTLPASELHLLTVGGAAGVALPGEDPRPVLHLRMANTGSLGATISSLAVTDVTAGPGTRDQLDAQWQELSLVSEFTDARATFSSGRAIFAGLDLHVPAGDTLDVVVKGAPSLAARDSALLRVQVTRAEDVISDGAPPQRRPGRSAAATCCGWTASSARRPRWYRSPRPWSPSAPCASARWSWCCRRTATCPTCSSAWTW